MIAWNWMYSDGYDTREEIISIEAMVQILYPQFELVMLKSCFWHLVPEYWWLWGFISWRVSWSRSGHTWIQVVESKLARLDLKGLRWVVDPAKSKIYWPSDKTFHRGCKQLEGLAARVSEDIVAKPDRGWKVSVGKWWIQSESISKERANLHHQIQTGCS